MPAVPSALTHNPLLLCYTESIERGINPLRSYLHKDIKETEGEQRGAWGMYCNMLLFSASLTISLFSPVSPSFLASKQTEEVPGVLSECVLVQQHEDRFV